MRLAGKVAIVVGAGQTQGDTIGNGRATAILFAREGAKVLLADRNFASARETEAMIAAEGGESFAVEADATNSNDCQRMVETCLARWQRIDILENVVGIGTGDRGATSIQEDDWNRIVGVNLKSVLMPVKHVVPVMRKQRSGSIINISSAAAVCGVSLVAYKTSKAGVNALTHSIAMGNAKYGIRANCIMPGLMNTPMAVESISAAINISKQDLEKARDSLVPLGGKQGTGWDVAYASLFLASDESKFITAVVLPVDGGQCARIG